METASYTRHEPALGAPCMLEYRVHETELNFCSAEVQAGPGDAGAPSMAFHPVPFVLQPHCFTLALPFALLHVPFLFLSANGA